MGHLVLREISYIYSTVQLPSEPEYPTHTVETGSNETPSQKPRNEPRRAVLYRYVDCMGHMTVICTERYRDGRIVLWEVGLMIFNLGLGLDLDLDL